MEPVRFGLIGYGFGGRRFHAPLIASAAECELVAVMTGSDERRSQVAAEHPLAAVVESIEALVALGVEAVAISTPVDTHTALSDEALGRGLAVVCDKPFALDPSAARATVELAERRGLALSPYQNRRWDSDFRTVRALVDRGTLGAVSRLESRFERYAPQNGPGPSGGGTLLDFFSHLADQALFLLGPATSVYAELAVRENGLDDDVFVALVHANGARSHLSGGWRQFAPGPRFRVTGTEATYIHEQGDTQEDRLVAGASPASLGERWGVEPDGVTGRLHRASGVVDVTPERGAWDAFYPAFAGAVRGTGPVPVAARDAIETALVLEAAKLSATTGKVVEIGAA